MLRNVAGLIIHAFAHDLAGLADRAGISGLLRRRVSPSRTGLIGLAGFAALHEEAGLAGLRDLRHGVSAHILPAYDQGVTIQAAPSRPRPAGEWERLTRLPADLRRALLADPETVERYHAKVYRRGSGLCWYWLGALSSSGHGRLRCGTRALDPELPGSRVIASHVYGFQLSRGLLQPDPGTGRLAVIRHRCDEASCHNPAHWASGTSGDNAADYAARGSVAGSPLTDRRGPGGRARAIRDAILATLAAGGSPVEVEAAIWSASAAGINRSAGGAVLTATRHTRIRWRPPGGINRRGLDPVNLTRSGPQMQVGGPPAADGRTPSSFLLVQLVGRLFLTKVRNGRPSACTHPRGR